MPHYQTIALTNILAGWTAKRCALADLYGEPYTPPMSTSFSVP
jgi:hypothetical protein